MANWDHNYKTMKHADVYHGFGPIGRQRNKLRPHTQHRFANYIAN